MATRTNVTKIIAAVLLLLGALAGGTLLAIGPALGLREVAVQSKTMEPAMPDGGLAFVEPVGSKSVHAGEIIAFRDPRERGATVIRRVHVIGDQLGGPTIWTQADANPAPDPWAVRPDDVLGRVRYTVPHLGAASRYAHGPLGLLAIGAAPAFALALLWSAAGQGRRREQRQEVQLFESRLRNAFHG
jgi:signal peptidase